MVRVLFNDCVINRQVVLEVFSLPLCCLFIMAIVEVSELCSSSAIVKLCSLVFEKNKNVFVCCVISKHFYFENLFLLF